MSETLRLRGVGIIKRVPWEDDLGGGFRIVGELAIIDPAHRGLYDCRSQWPGYEGTPVCRIGVWRKYRPDGSISWEIDYKGGEG